MSSPVQGEAEYGADDDVGDGEIVADEVVVVAECILDHGGSRHEAPRCALDDAGVGLAVRPHLAGDVHQRALELRHPEEAPLVVQAALVRPERADQARIEMLVRDVEDECRRLEDRAAVLLEHGGAAERMKRPVLRRLLVLAGHDGEVERRPELFEQPEDAGRPRTRLVMKSHGAILAGYGWRV